MNINANILTGNIFFDGSPEVGKVISATINTLSELDNLLDDIDSYDFFLTDEDGEEVGVWYLVCALEGSDEV